MIYIKGIARTRPLLAQDAQSDAGADDAAIGHRVDAFLPLVVDVPKMLQYLLLHASIAAVIPQLKCVLLLFQRGESLIHSRVDASGVCHQILQQNKVLVAQVAVLTACDLCARPLLFDPTRKVTDLGDARLQIRVFRPLCAHPLSMCTQPVLQELHTARNTRTVREETA